MLHFCGGAKSDDDEDLSLVTGFDNLFISNKEQGAQRRNWLWPHFDINESETNAANVSDWDVYQGLLYL